MNITRREVLKLPLAGAAAPYLIERGLAAERVPPKALSGALRFGVMGDSGSGKSAQHRVARQMIARERENAWEFILALGDNIYENGEPKYFESKFIDVYRPLLDKGVRIHAALGNHDVRTDGGRQQLAEPAFGYIDGKDEYEFAAGPTLPDGKRLARCICLNSPRWVEAVGQDDVVELGKLRDSLRERLRRVDDYRWNIVYMHHPVRSFTKGGLLFFNRGHGSSEELREALEPDLIEHGVDLVLAGHDHFYQKVAPRRGVHHLVSGAAGKLRKGSLNTAEVEFAADKYHFTEFSADADELKFQAIDDDGHRIHAGRIAKRDTAARLVETSPATL